MKPFIQRTPESQEYFFEEGCHILELHNTADDPALSVARARVPAGTGTRLHRLSGTVERYLILEGEGRVEVEGLEATPLRPGSVVVIPPDTAQRITNTGDGDLVFLAFCTPRFKPGAYSDADE